MPNLLNKLKNRANEKALAPISAQVIELPSDAKSVVCKNHFNIDPKGNRRITRVLITFLPNEKFRTCECGIVYKRGI